MLANQVAVITGANQGIGKAIAVAFAAEGASLALCARNGEKLSRVADELRATGVEVFAQVCDVSLEQDVEQLFTAVLEDAYLGIRSAEQTLHLDELPPDEAIAKLVRSTWNYYLAHPEFLTLVNSENLHRAKHLKTSEAIRQTSGRLVAMVRNILDRGVAAGIFREGIDPVQLNITIAAIGYYYLTNRFTGSIVYERDLMTKENLEARLAFNLDTILRLLKKDR